MKRTFLIFTLWTWLRVLYGLVFHPYKTVREVTRHPVLVPVVLSPFITVIVLFLFGRIGVLLVDLYGFSRSFVALGLSFILFSLVLWQVFIGYLLVCLISAKRRE